MDEKTIEVEQAIKMTTGHIWEAIKRATSGDYEAIVDIGYLVLTPSISALAILCAFYFAAKFVSKLVSGPINRRVDQTLGRFVEKLVYRGMIACGFLFVLNYFGVRSTSFAAVLAAAGFAIGLAFQGTLANFASGILLMVFRPFKVGDMVVANGIAAKVHEIDLFTTAVDTPDNRRLIIPNSAIAGQTIENVTYHPCRRVEVPVGVAYSADMDETRATLLLAIEAISESILENEERKSQVILVGLGSSAVDWVVRVWSKTSDFSDVRDKLVYSVKSHLDASNIPIPFPQLDLHVNQARAELFGHGAVQRYNPRRRNSEQSDAA